MALKISGNVRLYNETVNRYTPSFDVLPKLDIETKRKNGIKAVIEFDGSIADSSVYIQEAYIDYRFNKKTKLTFGWTKKNLGQEFKYNRESRLTIKRSIISQKLQTLGIVGRQLNLLGSYRPLGNNKFKIEGGFGTNGSRDYSGMICATWSKNSFGGGLWLMAELHRIDNVHLFIHGEAINIWYQSKTGKIELELIHAVDAHKTEFVQMFETNRRVHFVGPRLDVTMNMVTGKWTFSPVFQTAFLLNDIKQLQSNTLSYLWGINAKIHSLVLSINAQWIGEKEILHANKREMVPEFRTAATYYF